MVQSEVLAIDALGLYAHKGTEIAQRPIEISENLEEELNGENQASDLSILPDDEVLTRASDAQVFLTIRYRLDE
jgi:hypothetical protein